MSITNWIVVLGNVSAGQKVLTETITEDLSSETDLQLPIILSESDILSFNINQSLTLPDQVTPWRLGTEKCNGDVSWMLIYNSGFQTTARSPQNNLVRPAKPKKRRYFLNSDDWEINLAKLYSRPRTRELPVGFVGYFHSHDKMTFVKQI